MKGFWVTAVAYDLIVLLADETEASFNDLGKLLLGGVAAAVVFALLIAYLRFRMGGNEGGKFNVITIASKDDVSDKS